MSNFMKNVSIKDAFVRLKFPIEPMMLFLAVGYIMELWQFLRKVCIANFQCGDIRPLRLYVFVVPLVYIVIRRIYEKKLVFPNFGIFLTMLGAYVCLEYLPFRGSVEHYYAFFSWQVENYLLFFILYNYGFEEKTMKRVLNFSIVAWLVIVVISYIGLLGFLPIGFNVHGAGVNKRFENLGDANMVAYKCAFLFILLIIRQGLYKKWRKRDFLHVLGVGLSLAVLIAFMGTRGALVIFILVLGAYLVIFFREYNNKMLAYIIVGLFLLCYTAFWVNVGQGKLQYITVVRRAAYNRVPGLRYVNLRNSIKNFLGHPFVGVGYKQAAQRDGTGTRSNCQYTQLAAAWGIFFLMLFFMYYYKMLVGDRRLILRDEIVLMLIFWGIFLVFSRTRYIFAISAYVAAFYKHHLPFKDTSV